MLLCFSTAILSLAVNWSINNNVTNSDKSRTRGSAQARQAVAKPKSSPPLSFLNFSATQASNRQATDETKLVVDLSDRRVYVYHSGEVIASYPTGIGKKGWETPTGSFQIINKQLHPIWRHPITGKVFEAGADSPLGDRWIGFWSDGHSQIGFHGTPDDDLVGTAVSHGCLRMRNPDVRLLYKQVKLGTAVEVRS